MVRITADSPGVYSVRFPYNAEAVNAIKSLKGNLRAWDAQNKCWMIDQSVISQVAGTLSEIFNVTLAIPKAIEAATEAIKRVVTVEYLGQCKPRGNGEPEAYGYANESWSVVIPQSVLEAFFGEQIPEQKQTFYQVLCVTEKAEAFEIKTAYRRLARQWHPDVCREEGASEKFQQIKAAYDVLSDDLKKRRYDAGLYFERQGKQDVRERSSSVFVSPLRCGVLYVEGVVRMTRLRVSKIDRWEDITRADGCVLVTSWVKGQDHFQKVWVPCNATN